MARPWSPAPLRTPRACGPSHQQRAQRHSLRRSAAPGHRRPPAAFGAVGSGPKQGQMNRAASGSPHTAPSQRHKAPCWETGRPGTFVIFKGTDLHVEAGETGNSG